MLELHEPKRKLKRALSSLLKEDQWAVDEVHRISYGRDSCSQSILEMKHGKIKHPPDAVVWPESSQELSSILAYCHENSIPVIPFGGGSGVCGGTWATQGGISLDLKRLDQIIEINVEEMSFTAQAGINGEVLERALNAKGFSLRHFPSSIYCATLGGYLACRSAGQLSTKYGKVEDLVLEMEVVLADGRIISLGTGQDSSDLKELFMGSEGTLGVITKAKMKMFRLPEVEKFLTYKFSDLPTALKGIRQTLQSGIFPSVVRLYDETDTLLAHSYSEEGETSCFDLIKDGFKPYLEKIKNESLRAVLAKPSLLNKLSKVLPTGCQLIMMFEGQSNIVDEEINITEKLFRSLGAKNLGEGPGLYWKAHRYSVAYKLSPLFDEGFFADTMEVACTWDKLENLYEAVRESIGKNALAFAHFSHAYREGCSIYFTFVSYKKGAEASEKHYAKIWDEALNVCVQAGGVISHHHGVGLLKAKYMKDQWGENFSWLQNIKNILDPRNILNPGKLGLSS